MQEKQLTKNQETKNCWPFMMSKLIPFIRSWNNGYFYNRYDFVDVIDSYIDEIINDDLLDLYRKDFYKYQGLTGLAFSNTQFANYFEKNFFVQLKKYFKVEERPGKCSIILFVGYSNNKRWEDGHPGKTIAENFIFSGIFLYMIMAEQGVLKYNEEASNDFHQASGWPLIYSGPGAGPYLHPLRFIEYAGLLPSKSETPIYLEMAKDLFPFMRQKYNELLNGKGVMKETEAGERFVNAIRGVRGQIKEIKHYIMNQEEQIIKLLELWSDGQQEDCYHLLKSQNLPIMLKF